MAETKKKERKGKKEKPLERWTVKELREEALKIGGAVGVHGMNKEELVEALRKEKGIEPPASKKKIGNVREMKAKVIELRKARDEKRASDASRKSLSIMRKKISRMKKKTRRQA